MPRMGYSSSGRGPIIGVGFGEEPEWPWPGIAGLSPAFCVIPGRQVKKAKHLGLFCGKGSIELTPAIAFLAD